MSRKKETNKFPLSFHCDYSEVCFELKTAATMARVSENFVFRCEREELVSFRVLSHGGKGLCSRDVRKLKLIRHLHEDMGMDLEAVDFILRYRNRIKELQRQLNETNQQLLQKEKEYMAGILELQRQLADLQDGD